jgi:hypothetical protein
MTEPKIKTLSWPKALAIGLAGMVGLGMIIKAGDPRSVEQRAADRARAEAEEARQAVLAIGEWRRSFDDLARRCDAGISSIGAQIEMLGKGGAMLPAYQTAEMAEGACRAAHLQLGDIAVPDGLSSEQEDALDAAVSQCKTAFYVKRRVASAAMAIFDGDLSPSAQATLITETNGATEEAARCSALVEVLAPTS